MRGRNPADTPAHPYTQKSCSADLPGQLHNLASGMLVTKEGRQDTNAPSFAATRTTRQTTQEEHS